LERYPSIRLIVSHAGGTIPYLAWRMAGASYLPELRDSAPKTDPMALLQKLYYDTALSTSEFAFGALKEFVPTSQVLFGSDNQPTRHRPDDALALLTEGLIGRCCAQGDSFAQLRDPLVQ
jgi:predicted TIM-barrel fold metal-dependent hydrolase